MRNQQKPFSLDQRSELYTLITLNLLKALTVMAALVALLWQ